jgi:type IV secretory pathway VirB2 component (pilin)
MTNKLPRKNSLGAVASIATVLVLGAMPLAAPAMASGLDTATTYVTTLQSQLTTLIPIVCVIGMLVLGALYANRMIQKDSLVHWFIGVILAGSASELVAAFFTG